MTYLAYHNDPAIKAARVQRANWHKEQDLIAQGAFYNTDTHEVCNIACSLPREVLTSDAFRKHPYQEQAKHTGIAPVLTRLHDKLFEGTKKGCVEFAPRVFETLQVGADTERIAWAFVYELLSSELIQKPVQGPGFEQQRDAIDGVRKVFYDALMTGKIDKVAARAAADVAKRATVALTAGVKQWDAARAVYTARYAVTSVRAGRTAADAAAYAASDVARSTDRAVDAYITMRTMLLDIQANWDVATQQYTQLTPLTTTP